MMMRRATSGLLGTVMLATLLTPAMSAAAAPVTHEYEIDRSFLSTTREYGALQPEARRIVIGQNTSAVQFDPGIPVIGTSMQCGANDGVFGYHSYDWDVWNVTPVHSSFSITPGVIPSGAGYDFTCSEDGEESDTVTWHIVAEDVGPDTLVLDTDPAKLVSVEEQRNYSGTDFESRHVSPGDRVEISAPANTWGRPGTNTVPIVTLFNDGDFPDDEGEDITITPDGDLLAFTIPPDLGAGFFNGEGWVTASTISTVPGSQTAPTRVYRSDFETRFIYPAAQRGASETSIRLKYPIGISSRANKAFVTVKTDEPFGWAYVVLYVDGEFEERLPIFGAQSSSTVEFDVPQLARGRHILRAEFEQTQQHEGSTSRNLVLRIVI